MSDLDKLVKEATSRGWQVEDTKKGRLKLYHPNGANVFASKRSSARTLLNIKAQITRKERMNKVERIAGDIIRRRPVAIVETTSAAVEVADAVSKAKPKSLGETFGEALKALMTRDSMSRVELGKLVDRVPTAIDMWRKGVGNPSRDAFTKLVDLWPELEAYRPARLRYNPRAAMLKKTGPKRKVPPKVIAHAAGDIATGPIVTPTPIVPTLHTYKPSEFFSEVKRTLRNVQREAAKGVYRLATLWYNRIPE